MIGVDVKCWRRHKIGKPLECMRSITFGGEEMTSHLDFNEALDNHSPYSRILHTKNYCQLSPVFPQFANYLHQLLNIFNVLDGNSVLTERLHEKILQLQGIAHYDFFIFYQIWRISRNLSVAYTDYQKAYRSVLHSWLLEILRVYKTDNRNTTLQSKFMMKWRIKLSCRDFCSNDNLIRRSVLRMNA